MNYEQMTDDQLKIAVCEAIGWKWMHRAKDNSYEIMRGENTGDKFWEDYGFRLAKRGPINLTKIDLTALPDLTLDFMHQRAMELTGDERIEYAKLLRQSRGVWSEFHQTEAKVELRAIAWLKVKEWK